MTFDAILITANGIECITEVVQFDQARSRALVVTDRGLHGWVSLDKPKLVLS